MGVGQSRPSSGERTIPDLTISNEAVEQMANMNRLLDDFNKNNLSDILTYIENYNGVAAQKGMKPIVINDKIKKNITDFHGRLTNVFGPSVNGHNVNDVDASLKLLNDYIRQAVGMDREKATKLFKEEGINKDVSTIFDKFVEMKAKSAYFEYKYIQSYIFILAFTQHIYGVMANLMEEVVKINGLKENDLKLKIRELLNAIIDGVGKGTGVDANTDILKDMNDVLLKFNQNFASHNDRIKKLLEGAHKQGIQDILKFMIDYDETSTATIKQLLNDKERNGQQPSTSGTTSGSMLYPSAIAGPSAYPGAIAGTTSIYPGQRGGFIRGSSVMGEAFYDKSS